jgi:acyl-CoA reductase-like NAD-dependent aldehyde dehydrogenase
MTIATNGNRAAAAPALIPLTINNASIETAIKFDVTNPRSGQVIYRCSSASVKEANHAVEAAQTAFHVWSRLKPTDRRELLWKAADIMLSRKEELIRYQKEETGSDSAFATFTVMLGVNLLKEYAGRISLIEGTVPTVAQEGQSAMVVKEPYGVILGIAPWYEIIRPPGDWEWTWCIEPISYFLGTLHSFWAFGQ